MLKKNSLGVMSARFCLGISFALLAACAGAGRYVPSASPASADGNARSQTATTTAWGDLVSDPDAAALGGVPVELFPWKPCRIMKKAFQCPAAIVHTTTAKNGRFRFTAPNGHYLLVIGSNSGSDFTRPTVHDNVRLTGGVQHLLAPVLPTPSPMPNEKYWPVNPPADQLHGLYRLTTIEPKFEASCLRAIDDERQQHNFNALVADEWLTENERTLLLEYRHTKVEAPDDLGKTEWFRLHGSCGAATKNLRGKAAETDFGWLPPEINSALMYAGAGAGPLLDAASAWAGLAAELASPTNDGLLGGDFQNWP